MLEAISILLALVTGFLLVQAFDPVRNRKPRWAALLFDAALGAGIGIGLSSVIFLFLDIAGIAAPAVIFGIDVVLAGILAWRWVRTARAVRATVGTDESTVEGFRWTWLLALAFGVTLAFVWVRLVQMSTALPDGGWDAWAIWNLRAKYLAGPGGAWRYAVSPLLNRSHPDYPLLLSAFIARVWKAGGAMSMMVPAVTALVLFAALLALLIGAITLLRGAASALLAALVILSTTSLLVWAPADYSDIPIALFYLAALALLFLDGSSETRHWALFWAGLCAGFAAWTKNEGIAFLVSILIAFCALTLWQRGMGAVLSRARWLVAGAAPGVLLTLWLKFFLAPAVDPLVTQGASGLTRLTDASRYAEVAGAFFHNLVNLGSGISHPLILLAILAILLRWQMDPRNQLPSTIAAAALVLVFFSYCFVYLITPSGVAWQVQTSFDRLILQLWPSTLLVFFVQLKSVADAAPVAAPIKSAVARKSPVRSGKPGAAIKRTK